MMTAASKPSNGAAPAALITGASRGIGSHLAVGFLEAGYDLAVTSTSGGGFDDLAQRASSLGRRLLPLAVDVRRAGDVAGAVEQVYQEFPALAVLINNAGVIENEHPIWQADPDEWWNVLEVNVRGAFHISREVSARMIAAGGGRIINLNSGSGGSDSERLSAYHASKSALARITASLALTGEAHGLYAFDMAPGVVWTDMTQSMPLHDGRTEWTSPHDVVSLTLSLARGELDAFSGRMVRAGADTVDSLRERARLGLGDRERRLRWVSYGEGDPVVPQ